MNFGNLSFSTTPKVEVKPTTKVVGKLNFKQDVLKLPPKKTKEEIKHTEPGFKIGTGQFHSVSQWCDSCNAVVHHCHKPEKRRMICTTCKNITTY